MRSRVLRSSLLALIVLVALAGCGESEPDFTAAAPAFPTTPRTVFGGARPVTIQVPTTYNANRPAPLLVSLHGYQADGSIEENYLGLGALVESKGILIIAPDGTIDRSGFRFWNATPACCNFDGSSVDDVGYIRGLIADIRHDYNVDRQRIYLIGHSNGAFMAHRLACEAAHDIAAIVALAGATFKDAADCAPSEPVSVLDIHGDADVEILYEGGQINGVAYPSEIETMAHWQVYDHCAPGLVTDPTPLNLDFSLAGNETTVQYFNGCARGTAVELWTIHGGAHIPNLRRQFPTLVWQWLSDHPKH
jgi:polyhydroxybutyrate depolymerase